MTLLNTLYNKFFRNRTTSDTKQEEENSIELRASILIGVDKNQQYFFDIKWDYDNLEQTSNDLANLILGLNYGLFISQIKNLLLSHDITNRPYDEVILYKTMEIIEERSNILNNLISDNDTPIVKPSEVFRPNTDAKRE